MTEPVSPGTLTRQELYDRIRQSSKDEVILEEMIRLGFWPDGEAAPSPAAEAIRERADAIRELTELQRQNSLLGDPERALKEMHKRRKAEAMARRQETKRRHAQARQDRAQAWHERRKRDVLYLGEGVSAGLHVALVEARCTCHFYGHNKMMRGPCEHMLAVRRIFHAQVEGVAQDQAQDQASAT